MPEMIKSFERKPHDGTQHACEVHLSCGCHCLQDPFYSNFSQPSAPSADGKNLIDLQSCVQFHKDHMHSASTPGQSAKDKRLHELPIVTPKELPQVYIGMVLTPTFCIDYLIAHCNMHSKSTCAAILYSSTRGSFVRWIWRGSSVDRHTLSPREKNMGKGFRW
jgi:hypothetical protein